MRKARRKKVWGLSPRVYGVGYNDFPFIKTGMDDFDHLMWNLNAPGMALDEDGIAPNNNDMTWRY